MIYYKIEHYINAQYYHNYNIIDIYCLETWYQWMAVL